MKLMKLFLTGVLAFSALAPSLSTAMEPAPRPTGPATAAEITHAQTCGICQDDLTNGNDIRTLRCNANGVPHIFHRQCLNEWLTSQQRTNQPMVCPMCQTPAIPEFTLKEQVIAKAQIINYQHNPLSEYNRMLTANLAGCSAAAIVANILTVPLVLKYLGNKDINYRGTVREFSRVGALVLPALSLANYTIIRYLANYIQGTNFRPQHFAADRQSLLKVALAQGLTLPAVLAVLLQCNIVKIEKP